MLPIDKSYMERAQKNILGMKYGMQVSSRFLPRAFLLTCPDISQRKYIHCSIMYHVTCNPTFPDIVFK